MYAFNSNVLKKEKYKSPDDSKDVCLKKSNYEKNSLADLPLELRELVTNNGQQKNWKGILLALLVILVISAFITLASILTTPSNKENNYGKPLPINVMRFNPRNNFNPKLLKSSLIYKDPKTMKYQQVRYDAGKIEDIFEPQQDELKYVNMFSDDLDYVIFQKNSKSGFRHSFQARYEVRELSEHGLGKKYPIGLNEYLHLVVPSVKKGQIAYCMNNQVFYHRDVFSNSQEFVHASINLPTGNISYGTPDWIYEEEIFSNNIGTWWSPAANYLAFIGTDNSNVSTQEIIYFQTQLSENIDQTRVNFPYPKAGETRSHNTPIINVFIHNVNERETVMLQKPDEINEDMILSFLRWIGEEYLLVTWLNREQTKAWITLTSLKTRNTKVIFRHETTNGWTPFLKSDNEPIYDSKSKSLYLILPRNDDLSEYRGIARLKINFNEVTTEVDWITTPPFDADDILWVNENDTLFTSSGPRTYEKHLFWFREGYHSIDSPVCLSCGHSNCTYSEFHIRSRGDYLVQNCRGPKPSAYSLKKLELVHDKFNGLFMNETVIMDWAPSIDLVERGYAVPNRKFMTLTIRPSTPAELNVTAEVITPRDLDEKHITKYPLLLYTYGGPIRRMVRSEVQYRWVDYISSFYKVVVLIVDGRGTSGRGQVFQNAIYKKFSIVETQDQLDAVKAFVKQNSFIDRTKIAAYGWSYGGFTVGHLLAHHGNTDLIKCGISIAPVTDFRFYNTAYSERYLGLYRENSEVYHRTSIISKADKFSGKRYLLVHGMADDNVHIIQSTKLLRALLDNNVDVDFLFYPDQKHSLGDVREHFLAKKTQFLIQCYNKTMEVVIPDEFRKTESEA